MEVMLCTCVCECVKVKAQGKLNQYQSVNAKQKCPNTGRDDTRASQNATVSMSLHSTFEFVVHDVRHCKSEL